MNKEILPYYDKKGKRLGLMERKEIHKKGLINKHVAYLINDEHGWILQLRNKDKSQNPNVWDKPGGHYNVNDDFSR